MGKPANFKTKFKNYVNLNLRVTFVFFLRDDNVKSSRSYFNTNHNALACKQEGCQSEKRRFMYRPKFKWNLKCLKKGEKNTNRRLTPTQKHLRSVFSRWCIDFLWRSRKGPTLFSAAWAYHTFFEQRKRKINSDDRWWSGPKCLFPVAQYDLYLWRLTSSLCTRHIRGNYFPHTISNTLATQASNNLYQFELLTDRAEPKRILNNEAWLIERKKRAVRGKKKTIFLFTIN